MGVSQNKKVSLFTRGSWCGIPTRRALGTP